MPKFEAYNDEFNNTAELSLKPSAGDLRINNSSLEKMDSIGQWCYVCDIQQLDTTVLNHDLKLHTLESWMESEKAKATPDHRSDLEQQFDDLKEAGEALDNIETLAQTARIRLRELEDTVDQARITYRQMTKYTTEKLKTFEQLDTPYPDQDNKTGYQI